MARRSCACSSSVTNSRSRACIEHWKAGGSGSAELESFTAELDAETDRLSPEERRIVAAFLEELIALDPDERAS